MPSESREAEAAQSVGGGPGQPAAEAAVAEEADDSHGDNPLQECHSWNHNLGLSHREME